MNVGWIAPLNKKCGIAFYSRKYANELLKHVKLVECDPDDFIHDKKRFAARLSECGCVHIQYDPSFFLHGRLDGYPGLCGQLKAKKIVTLHEIYGKAPGVFSREDIRGPWPLKAIKEVLWDRRHPHWAAFARHGRRSFFADAVVVHSQFQKDILTQKGIDEEEITVVPLPIKPRPGKKSRATGATATIVLGAAGFINPSYDYDLLVRVLGHIKGDWRFTWIGGPRRNDDTEILRGLQNEIDKRGWKQRFTVTGWVSDEERDRLLDEMNIFCAFFKERSSSESLADAIAAKMPIIATRIPLTLEMASFGPLLFLAPDKPEKTAEYISALLSDKERLYFAERAAAAYAEQFSYEECAKKLVHLYESVIGK